MMAKCSRVSFVASLLLAFAIVPIYLIAAAPALGYQDSGEPEILMPGTQPAPPLDTTPAKPEPAKKVPAKKKSDEPSSTLLPIPTDNQPQPQSIETYIDGEVDVVEGNGYRETGDCGCESCETGCGYCGGGCGSCGGFWARGDYLIWWSKGNRLPPLVTTSPAGTPRSEAGVLGEPGTTVLFGDSTVSRMARSGYRITLGYWLDCCRRWGIEGDYLDTGANRANFYTNSTGSPIVARPFYNVETGEQFSQITAYPGVAAGCISATVSSHLQSTGIRLRHNLMCCTWCEAPACEDACCEDDSCGEDSCGGCGIGGWGAARSYRLDLIGGYRYYRLNDRFEMDENLVSTAGSGPLVAGTIFNLHDSFHTTNDFHGGEVGLVATFEKGCWSLELLGKLGIGNNHQVVTINGSTAVTVPGDETVFYNGQGGLLALPSNIGTHSQDSFVLIPQFGIEVGYQLTCNLRAYAGYNFLYWTNVLRAGDQIDLNIDPRNLPPAEAGAEPFPAVLMAESSFWAQGINLGMELRY